MLAPARPVDERARLDALVALGVLDAEPEERFDRITRLAARCFETPVALITLVASERVWALSSVGVDGSDVPRELSFCGHAILDAGALVVPDALADPRFADNPLVTGEPHLRFYAGAPLVVGDGRRVGTLCVVDHRPRSFDPSSVDALRDLAGVASRELEASAHSTVDELTGLANRTGFLPLARHALAVADRSGEPASLLLVEVDGVDAATETHGAHAGEALLVVTARLLRNVLRDSDVVARVGDTRFAAMLSGAGDADAAIRRLRDALDRHNGAPERGRGLSIALGALRYEPGSGCSPEDLVRRAEHRMRAQREARQAAEPL